ncbi:MAG: hypothetical protein M4579_005219 [Chaenotheca gracillima]|nr:MAG: hypothetical protein M4579_005219 [Chaenotheca gracillima]
MSQSSSASRHRLKWTDEELDELRELRLQNPTRSWSSLQAIFNNKTGRIRFRSVDSLITKWKRIRTLRDKEKVNSRSTSMKGHEQSSCFNSEPYIPLSAPLAIQQELGMNHFTDNQLQPTTANDDTHVFALYPNLGSSQNEGPVDDSEQLVSVHDTGWEPSSGSSRPWPENSLASCAERAVQAAKMIAPSRDRLQSGATSMIRK